MQPSRHVRTRDYPPASVSSASTAAAKVFAEAIEFHVSAEGLSASAHVYFVLSREEIASASGLARAVKWTLRETLGHVVPVEGPPRRRYDGAFVRRLYEVSQNHPRDTLKFEKQAEPKDTPSQTRCILEARTCRACAGS